MAKAHVQYRLASVKLRHISRTAGGPAQRTCDRSDHQRRPSADGIAPRIRLRSRRSDQRNRTTLSQPRQVNTERHIGSAAWCLASRLCAHRLPARGRPYHESDPHRSTTSASHNAGSRARPRCPSVSLGHADEPSFGAWFCARRCRAERRIGRVDASLSRLVLSGHFRPDARDARSVWNGASEPSSRGRERSPNDYPVLLLGMEHTAAGFVGDRRHAGTRPSI